MSRGAAPGTLEQVRSLEAQAEQAYTLMYDCIRPTTAAGHYSDAKDFLCEAIALARQLEDVETVTRLEKRLEHIKAVFRSQFS